MPNRTILVIDDIAPRSLLLGGFLNSCVIRIEGEVPTFISLDGGTEFIEYQPGDIIIIDAWDTSHFNLNKVCIDQIVYYGSVVAEGQIDVIWSTKGDKNWRDNP